METVKNLIQNLTSGSITSEQIILQYLEKIATIDQGNPKYNSIREVNIHALAEAKRLDLERQSGNIRSPLHGIPVVLKDNINTTGVMATTAGTYAFKDHFAKEDATLVKTLKDKGLIILGKANLTELANFMAINMKNGYSSYGGQVLYPFDLSDDPSGSSAGSAVSVSIDVTPLSIGTETSGSIMSPSMHNGIIGIKPTIGLVSRTGIVPISSTLDTAGPMGRTVYDVALLLEAMVSKDDEDRYSNTQPDDLKTNYSEQLSNTLKPLNIGIVRTSYNQLSNNQQDIVDSFIASLREHKLMNTFELKIDEPKIFMPILFYEFENEFNQFLSTYQPSNKVHSLFDLIRYNREYKNQTLKYGQKILEMAHNYNDLNAYHQALKERDELTKQLKRLFYEYKLDAIYFVGYTSLGPLCGFPSMNVPMGLLEGKPIGTYLLGNQFEEGRLLQVASIVETITGGYINPFK
jgi:amidase